MANPRGLLVRFTPPGALVCLLVAASAVLAALEPEWRKPKAKDLDQGVWKIEQAEDGTWEALIEVEVELPLSDGAQVIRVDVLDLAALPPECLPAPGQPYPCVPDGGVPPGVSRLESPPLTLEAPPHGKGKGKGAAKKTVLDNRQDASWAEIKIRVE